MGNFNMLCGASQQVIQQGDRCYILPIIQQSSYSPRSLKLNGKTIKVPGVSQHHCYPDCQWTWLGNFLEVTYTDRCDFALLDTVPNQVRMFFLAYTLMEKAPVAHDGSVQSAFDIKGFISTNHPELYLALNAATPTNASDWRLVVPANLAEHFASLAAVFGYLYQGVLESMVYMPPRNQVNTVTAVQFALYHGVVFDKLVARGAAEKDTAEAFFKNALPQTDPERPGGLLAALSQALRQDWEQNGAPGSDIRQVLQSQFGFALDRLVRAIQHSLYYAPHGQHGEFEEVAHILATSQPGEAVEDTQFAAVKHILEARFALNAMGRELLLITPMRTCGDEGNCYGERYAEFIAEASAVVTASIPVRW